MFSLEHWINFVSAKFGVAFCLPKNTGGWIWNQDESGE